MAFEALMDFLVDRIRRYPGMHIYHYAHYEPTALKRLMSLHGTREAQVDDLLRGEKFVDLYKVVRGAIRTSEPGLSIKDLEIFYMPPREGDVTTAGGSIVHYERWRVTRDDAELEKIRAYNEDDCRSTHLLRDWLLTQRPAGLPWFVARVRRTTMRRPRSPAPTRSKRIEAGLARHREALLGGVPDDRATWNDDQRVRALVFDLLDFHRRAAKPAWWAMFARRDMTEDELIDDVECLGALTSVAGKPPVPVKQSLVSHVRVSRAGDQASRRQAMSSHRHDESAGRDRRARRGGANDRHQGVARRRSSRRTLSIGPEGPIGIDSLRDAVWRFAESHRGERRTVRRALRGLLRKDAPVLSRARARGGRARGHAAIASCRGARRRAGAR